MQRTSPPFRADHVGSLLRPAALKQAREARERGEIDAATLAAAEDEAIRAAIRRQEEIGLQAVTDGEHRRAMWHFDFLEGLDGVEGFRTAEGISFRGGVRSKPKGIRVVGPIGYSAHPMVGHFRFLAANARATPKMTIPSPSVLHFRGGRKAVPESIYPTMEPFYADLGAAYGKAVADFGAAGCRYLQIDEVNLAYLCDPEQRQFLSGRGDDPEKLPQVYADLVNAALKGRPPGMTVAMHLCRGNFRSTWLASGGYEPVAEILFNGIGVDAYFMEWDDERAGGFEPLRFVPKGKTVVLGLVTTKRGDMESRDELRRRIDEASRYIPLDQLCLSPQCGFASTEEGNDLAEADQWAKLRTVVELADEVWG